MNLNEKIREELLQNLSKKDSNRINQLNQSLRLLSKWRSVLIQNTLLQHEGKFVLNGPFKGMEFLEQSSEGCHIAKLLGCYEQPLFQYLETAIKTKYNVVINIGSAEGYYAIGMALRMPESKILAFDTNQKAQDACSQLALVNKVADRIQIGGTFDHNHFKRYDNQDVLLLCDIEGAEQELLDPEKAEELKGISIIVESHECLRPGITNLLVARFSPTHSIVQVNDSGSRTFDEIPNWFNELSHLDQLLATWEWRSGPTPWLIMTPNGTN